MTGAPWADVKAEHHANDGWVEGSGNRNPWGEEQGAGDAAYCVDLETEILSRRGWLTEESVHLDDEVLTFDMGTGGTVWSPLLRIIRLPAATRSMLAMDTKVHSSLSTADHRWPVERRRGTGTDRHHVLTVTTSGEGFKSGDRLILAAPHSEFPSEPKWSDDLVAAVAWFWTEGSIRAPGTALDIYQSAAANPTKCAHIRDTLTRLFGPAVASMRIDRKTITSPAWREWRDKGGRKAIFSLNQHAGRELLEHAPGRVPTPDFLLALTQSQLRLFIDVSIAADGHITERGQTMLAQKSTAAADAFQMACTLAGVPTHRWVNLYDDPPVWRVSLLTRDRACPGTAARKLGTATVRQPTRATVEWVSHDGPVWCVETSTGTWFARRRGSVFVTGNCFSAGSMVPYHHGVRWPKIAQFGERGWAYTPYGVSDAVRLGIWEPGHSAVCHEGDGVFMDWAGDGVADHFTTAIDDELTGRLNVHTAEYNAGHPEGAHFGMWRPRQFVLGVAHYCRLVYAGATPPPPPPPAPASPDANQFCPLVVDGQFGPTTIKALQWKLNHVGAHIAVDGDYGPATKKMLQARLNATNPPVGIDGDIGPQTIRALQTHVGVRADGQWGGQTTAGLQTVLNAGTF